MPVAGIQEQLRAIDGFGELSGGVEVFVRRQDPLVGVHHVDLERDALRPRAAELGGRNGRVKQQGSLCAGPGLSEHLRRQHPEREPGVDDAVGQAVRSELTALDDRVEADFLRVANAAGEVGEGIGLVEIRCVHDVSGSAESIGEGEASTRQALRVVKEQNLSHGGQPKGLLLRRRGRSSSTP